MGSANEVAGRTIAIGDIHGCSEALRTLLKAIVPRQKDTVVTLGNVIDQGPDSNGVILLLLSLVGRCKLVPLKGHHEEMFLAALEGHDDFHSWRAAGGEQTLGALRHRPSERPSQAALRLPQQLRRVPRD